MRYQPLAQIGISMFGKIWKLSMAHFLTLPGLVPPGVTMRCGPSSGVIIVPRSLLPRCPQMLWNARTRPRRSRTTMIEVSATSISFVK